MAELSLQGALIAPRNGDHIYQAGAMCLDLQQATRLFSLQKDREKERQTLKNSNGARSGSVMRLLGEIDCRNNRSLRKPENGDMQGEVEWTCLLPGVGLGVGLKGGCQTPLHPQWLFAAVWCLLLW